MRFIFLGILLILSFIALSLYQFFKFNDGKLHVVFCNVGQGDGIYMRTPKGLDIIVDGGPDDSMLSCLSEHMPFWDREIELMFLTHPHADHIRGLVDVLKKYEVQNFSTEKVDNDTDLHRELINAVRSEGLEVRNLYAGDTIRTKDGVMLRILYPSSSFLKASVPTGLINESSELASLIMHISYKDKDIILTGDSEVAGLKEAVQGPLPSIEVLQIPHHGSRFGLDREIIEKINPQFGVISVGKNKYGHPTKFILDLLSQYKIKTLRTDISGDIHFVF